MAISSYQTYLKWGTSADNVAKVVNIKTFGDLIGDPEQLETTTMSDGAQTFIPGIRQSSSIQFTCNYTSADYALCQADAGKPLYFELNLQDGSKFEWQGQFTLGVPGKNVNEVMEFTINVLPSTEVTQVSA